MPEFRESTPKRRAILKQKKDYRSYKKELREDFNKRCGYCDDPDSWKDAFYEIDHFVPKSAHFNLPVLYKIAVLSRGDSQDALEVSCEMTLVSKSCFIGHRRN